MNKTLFITLFSIIGLIIIIVICTIVAINEDKKLELYNETITEITEAATKCVKEEVCNEGKITLKELYKSKYLTIQKNPKTNKYFSDASYVEYPEMSFYIK